MLIRNDRERAVDTDCPTLLAFGELSLPVMGRARLGVIRCQLNATENGLRDRYRASI